MIGRGRNWGGRPGWDYQLREGLCPATGWNKTAEGEPGDAWVLDITYREDELRIVPSMTTGVPQLRSVMVRSASTWLDSTFACEFKRLPPFWGSEGGVFWDWCWGLTRTHLEFSPDF